MFLEFDSFAVIEQYRECTGCMLIVAKNQPHLLQYTVDLLRFLTVDKETNISFHLETDILIEVDNLFSPVAEFFFLLLWILFGFDKVEMH